jgi:hypothetical protein
MIPFEVQIRSRACVRKVNLVQSTTLPPGKSLWVRVSYKSLPRDRSFALNAVHPTVSNAIVDAKSPRGCLLTNPTQETINLSKGTRLATITESTDSGYFVTDLTTAWKALSTAATLGIAASSMTHPIQGTSIQAPSSFTYKRSPVPAIGAEFDLTPTISSILRTPKQPALTASTPVTMPAADSPADAPIPFSDAVFNIIQSSANPIPQDEPLGPRARPTRTNPAIKTPADAPELITKQGVHIYAKDRAKASKLEEIINRYPAIWTDQGIIDLPIDQQLKVPLVDGWQNAKLNSRPYPLSRKDLECLNKTFDPMHEQGRMQWVDEPSPFAHPVFVVWRTVHGNEKGRVVIDMRQLNKYGVPDCYPLPLQQEVIQSLRSKRYITVIDAASFFYQFRVHPDYQDRFTISSPRGIERFTVAPMGFRNSPAYVQRFMDKFLRDHRSYCRAFIDDIVIYSDTFQDHIQHLNIIFELFTKKRISIAPKKSFIGYPSVELLGFQVDALGLSTTRDRMAAFQSLEFPAQLKALETYLGATGFLRHLIPYYAQLAEPLQKRKTALLAKGRAEGRVINGNPQKRLAYTRSTYYEPTPEESLSFKELQAAVCQQISLAHFNPDSKLFLQIDGSIARGFGVMVFHTQEGYKWEPGSVIPSTVIQPIMFLSRCLTNAELRYRPSELEVACLVWAARKLRTTLHSSNLPVAVITDHSATKGIVDQTTLNTTSTDRANRRLINASVYLSQYQLNVYHIPGRLNHVPDALSRLQATGDDTQRQSPEPATLDNVWFASEALMNDEMRQRFIQGYQADHLYQKIVTDLVGDKPSNEDVTNASKVGHPFCLIDSLLYNTAQDGTRRLCIPHDLIKDILELPHDQKHHFGRDRMTKDLSNLHFHRKSYLVKKYCEHCPTCQLNRTDRQQTLGNYEPIRTPEEPMHTITIDFIVGLPEASATATPWQIDGFDIYNALMTTTDKSSKRSLLIPGHDTYKAADWATVFTRALLLCDWGIPKVIISDRDPKFTSDFWNGIWKALGTRLMMTSAYHPQADGQSERKNQTVEIAIRYHTFMNPDEPWIHIIPSLQWNLNSAYNESIQASAHEYLFGFKIAGPLDRLTSANTTDLDDICFMREHLRKDAQLALDFAAARAKRRYDNKHRPIEFKKDDEVFLKLHHGYTLPGKPNRKYSQQRAGRFKIKRKVSPLAYELEIPEAWKIHPVISIAHLSPCPNDRDPFNRTQPPPGPLEYDADNTTDADGEIYELERIVDHKEVKRGRKTTYKYLVRWKGYGAHEDVWKKETELRHAPLLISEYWKKAGSKEAAKKKKR